MKKATFAKVHPNKMGRLIYEIYVIMKNTLLKSTVALDVTL